MLGRNTPSWSTSLRLRSPPERSTLSGRERKLSSKPTPLASAANRAGILAGSRPGGSERLPERVHQAHPGHFDRVLQGEEEPGASALPCWHHEKVGTVQSDRARDDLVPRPAGYDVRKRGLA